MTKYRKRPVVIDAWRVNDLLIAAGVQWSDLPPEIAEAYELGAIVFARDEIHVNTLEGTMIGQRADYLIRGVQGEFYPCKPDIFTATYEPEG